ncbi:MAG: hypothetical protein IJ515_00595 [Clostridia bacterium]|nr:hypothetical protein [Clostridia bacterium]
MDEKIKVEDSERIRRRVLALIDSEFESDAAFERAMGLADKTVNNWRRGRSASYMKMLPRLAEELNIGVSEILDMPLKKDGAELSEDEVRLLQLYRKTRTMPKELRAALRESIESVINLYVKSAHEVKSAAKKRSHRGAQKGGAE